MSKNISRFYLNFDKYDIEKELDQDFPSSELEDYSSDEVEPDVEDIMKEDNKKQGYIHAKSINEEMEKMSNSFNMMRKSTE